MPNNEITLDVSGGGGADVTLETTPGTGTEIEMDTQGGGGSDGPYARKAEAWAVGKRGGVDVPSTDETYHNNSKYWAENASFLRAQLAVMVGNLEGLDQEWEDTKDELVEELTGTVEDAQAAIQADMDALEALKQTLIDDGLRVLNGPNLIKQPTFTTRDYPSSAVISEEITIPAETAAEAALDITHTITDAAITSSYKIIGVTSRIYAIASISNVTGAFSAGSATITIGPRNGSAAHDALTITVHIATTSSQSVPYGETSHSYATGQPYIDSIQNNTSYPGQENDEIAESVVTLTGNNIVTDEDNTQYTSAVQFTVTNPPASSGTLNADKLVWKYGTNYIEMENGQPKYKRYNQIDEMTVGKRYTMSCFARMTAANTKAMLWLGCCPNQFTKVPNGYTYIEVSSTSWVRVSFTFDFNPTGTQFYTFDSTKTVEGQTVNVTYQAPNWLKQIAFGVCRKYAGSVQLCGFRLVEGDLYRPDLNALLADYQELHTRQTNLEAVQLNLFGAAGNEF